MSPPQRLRVELERLRERGYSFRQAWPAAVSRAVAGESAYVAVFWRQTWQEQRAVWACSYSRVRWPANLRTPIFVTEYEGHHDQHGTVQVVA